ATPASAPFTMASTAAGLTGRRGSRRRGGSLPAMAGTEDLLATAALLQARAHPDDAPLQIRSAQGQQRDGAARETSAMRMALYCRADGFMSVAGPVRGGRADGCDDVHDPDLPAADRAGAPASAA